MSVTEVLGSIRSGKPIGDPPYHFLLKGSGVSAVATKNRFFS